jgi:hypothetical protein
MKNQPIGAIDNQPVRIGQIKAMSRPRIGQIQAPPQPKLRPLNN